VCGEYPGRACLCWAACDDLLVVAEEYGLFEDSRRRVDLLALDLSFGPSCEVAGTLLLRGYRGVVADMTGARRHPLG
jgi:hypothetical protein